VRHPISEGERDKEYGTDLRDHKCNRPNVVGKDEDYWYGASQCGPLCNALNPTLGLKNSFF
jgi:hypothetical protein